MDNLADLVVSVRSDFGDTSAKTAELTKTVDALGAQAKETGDALAGSLDAQLDALFAKGMNLAEALASIAPPLEDAGGAASAAAEQLSLFDEAANVSYADASGQLNLFATELEPLAPALQEASNSLVKYTFNAHDAGDASHHAHEGAHELLTELLEFAGITVSLEALKEFATEAVHVYAETERVQMALGFMTKDAAQAAETIEALEAMAQEFGVAFQPLLGVQQRLTTLGVSLEGIRRTLEGAINDAAETGTSFERVSSSMERMAITGMASNRQLFQLRLTTADLAKAMGVTADQVSAAFKGLPDAEARLDVLNRAMEKFDGAGKAMAESTTASMQKLANQWEFALKEMGKALAPVVNDALPMLTAAIKDVVAAGIYLMVGMNEIANWVVGRFSLMTTAAEGFGKIFLKLMSHDYAGAVAAAESSYADMKAVGKFSWDAMVEDAKKGMDAIDELFKKHEKTKKGGGEGSPPPKIVPYEQLKLEVDAQAAHQKALLEQKRQGYLNEQALGQISAADNLERLREVAREELVITEDAIKKKLALEKSSKAEQKDLTLNSQLTAARDKEAAEEIKLNQTVALENKKAHDKEIADWSSVEDKRLAYARRVAEERQKIDDEEEADREKALLIGDKSEQKHQTALIEIARAANQARAKSHQITVFEEMAEDADLAAREEALQKKALEKELEDLNEAGKADVNYYSKKAALEAQFQALRDRAGHRKAVADVEAETAAWRALGIESDRALKTQIEETRQSVDALKSQGASQMVIMEGQKRQLEQEIKLKEQQGESASSEIKNLALLTAATDALVVKSEGLGPIYQGLARDFNSAFNTMGNELTQVITRVKSVGAAAKEMGLTIASSILNTVIGGALKQLAAAITLQIAGWLGLGAAQTASAATAAAATHAILAAQNVAAVISYEGVADAATVAAYAGIPFAGPAIAAAQIAAIDGLMATFMGMAAAKGGFEVGEREVMTMLHPKEMVLPADLSTGLKGMIRGGGPQLASAVATGGIGSGPLVDMRGAHFNGVTDDLVEQLMTKVTTGLRQIVGNRRNF